MRISDWSSDVCSSDLGQLACPVCGLFLLQRIDQIDGGEEADLFAVMLNSLDAQSRRDVAFACAWSADQYDVVGAICKVTAVKLTHERLVDLTDGKVEACQILRTNTRRVGKEWVRTGKSRGG